MLVCASAMLTSALSIPQLRAQETEDNVSWRYYGNNLANTRFQNTDRITTSNAGQLQVAWVFPTGVNDPNLSMEMSPIVIGGAPSSSRSIAKRVRYRRSLITQAGSPETGVEWRHEASGRARDCGRMARSAGLCAAGRIPRRLLRFPRRVRRIQSRRLWRNEGIWSG